MILMHGFGCLLPAPSISTTTRNSMKQSNPFQSQNRTNFPPLDEFFDQLSSSGHGSPTSDAGNTSASSPNQSFHSRTFDELNFSVDMSIGGKAEMAQHRYQVQKYGIDGIRHQQGDGSPGSKKQGLRLTEGDDWDRIMDASCADISFSSTAIVSARRHNNFGYNTPSPDQSSDDGSITSTSFFDKSVIQSLRTPEKMRSKMCGEHEKTSRVTLSRGQVYDSSDSVSTMDDPERSTNVSSTGSGFEGMFHAALRFNEDFDEQSSLAKDECSLSPADRLSSKDKSRDKSSSVSFAADTSFATSDSRYPSNNQKQQESSFENVLKGCSLSASPIEEHSNGESLGADVLKEFNSLFASPLHQRNKDEKFGGCRPSPSLPHRANKTEIFSLESCVSPISSVSQSDGHSGCQVKTDPSPSNLLLFSLSPIDSHAAERNLKSPTHTPFDEKHTASHSPLFDESYSHRVKNLGGQSSVPIYECTKKHLFPKEEDTYELSSPLSLEINANSIEVIQEMPPDQYRANTTVKSEASYSEQARAPSPSEETSPFSHVRTFGSNAAFRINSNVTHIGRSDRAGYASGNNNDSELCEENRRGVRLSRLSKLRELGLEPALLLSQKTPPEQRGDSSF